MIALLLALLAPAHARSTADTVAVYHALRDRLHADFLAEGTGPGRSIPLTWRIDAISAAQWSDGTVQLGWYLGVLATEHAMLADPQRFPGFGDPSDVEANRRDLHDALAAAERLDRIAETGFPDCISAELTNGFFVRDDVPSTLGPEVGVTSVLSDWTSLALTNKEMSQDQVIHLLLGLELTADLVPHGVVVDGDDLHDHALAIAERVLAWTAADGWHIRNPVCNRDVARGADATGFATGLNAVAQHLLGHTFSEPAYSATAWSTLESPANPAYLNSDNRHMVLVIAALGEGWGDHTLSDVVALSTPEKWWAYPLLFDVLYQPDDWASVAANVGDAAQAQLDELPAGAEPASPRPGGPVAWGWTVDNRFIRPASSDYSGAAGTDGQRYHGLDWMLLHNLHALAFPEAWQDGSTGDSGAQDTGPADTGPADTGATDTAPGPRAPDTGADTAVTGAGCGCATGSGGGGAWAVLLALFWTRRRRR